ncbi:hypothetical protein HDU93_006276 [Gonapodya sp. JEL0774]|nr:hypothetical protein HDU93_006276 [Gonapodya sp. JEL0774]
MIIYTKRLYTHPTFVRHRLIAGFNGLTPISCRRSFSSTFFPASPDSSVETDDADVALVGEWKRAVVGKRASVDAARSDLRLSPPNPPFTRRMWAGGTVDISLTQPLVVGGVARCEWWINKVENKVGKKSGKMVVVEELREVAMLSGGSSSGAGGRLLGGLLSGGATGRPADNWSVKESREVVYLKDAKHDGGSDGAKPNKQKDTSPARTTAPQPTFQRTVSLNEIDLFRLSALIFNANRVHYDLPYAHAAGHPDLVVAGPHISLLLLDAVARMTGGQDVLKWTYRALSPLYVNTPISFNVLESTGNPGTDGYRSLDVWAADADGRVGMRGTAVVGKRM